MRKWSIWTVTVVLAVPCTASATAETPFAIQAAESSTLTPQTALLAPPSPSVSGETSATAAPAGLRPIPVEAPPGGSRTSVPCPPGTIWGQPGNGPDEAWNGWFSGQGSNSSFVVYENFTNVPAPICDLHWYGFGVSPSITPCPFPPGAEFEVRFYLNAPGGPSGDCCHAHSSPGCTDTLCRNSVCSYDPYCCNVTWDQICAEEAATDSNCQCRGTPGQEVCSYVVQPMIQQTGIIYVVGGTPFELLRFTVNALPVCCELSAGWVSIVSRPFGNDCFFAWLTSDTGDDYALQSDQGGIPYNLYTDLAVCFTTCDIDCQFGSVPEGEPDCYDGYVDNYNGGCNSDPPVFTPIQCGQAICGRTGNYNNSTSTRDTDWYEIVTTEPTVLSWRVVGEFPTRIGILDGNNGCNYTLLALADSLPCEPVHASAGCLPPGRYWLVVTTVGFSGVPCGAEYVAQLTCQPCGQIQDLGRYNVWMDSAGNLFTEGVNDGWSDPEFGGPWFRYPEWWNIWWENEFAPPGGSSGDCCFMHEYPGCADSACRDSVCSYDPYCCNVEWDSICANEARTDPNCDCGRHKTVRLTIDVLTWNDGYVDVALNYSDLEWTNPQRPPLPWEDEFVRRDYLGHVTTDGSYVIDWTWPFCPRWVSLDVFGERFWIEGTYEHICWPQCCPGDTNCDGVVDFGDINPFVAGLTGGPLCNPCNFDINGNGAIGFDDINPFVALLVTGGGPCP